MYPQGYCKCLRAACWYCSQMNRILRGLMDQTRQILTIPMDERCWIIEQHESNREKP